MAGFVNKLNLSSGLTNPKDIVTAMFQFIKRVKQGGVNEQLWMENKQIDELKFKFKEKEDPASYARLDGYSDRYYKVNKINSSLVYLILDIIIYIMLLYYNL